MYDLPDDDQRDESRQENEEFGFTFHETTFEEDDDDGDMVSLHISDLEAITKSVK